MAFVFPHDRVFEHSTSNSQTVFAVTGAVDASFNAFNAFMSVGDTTIGAVVEPGNAFASGILTYSATNQLTLTTAYESKGTFSSTGTKEVYMGFPAKGARPAIYAAPFDALSSNNMILNGGMEIAQEIGVAGFILLTATGTLQSKYMLDGVGFYYRGSFVAEAAQVDIRSGTGNTFAGFLKAVVVQVATAEASLGANDELTMVLPVEGYRVGRLSYGYSAASPMTVGFMFYSVVGGTYSGSIKNAAKNRSYPFSFTVAAGVETYVTVTIPGDQAGTWLVTNAVGLYLSICLAGGSSRVGTGNAWAGSDYSGATGTANGVSTTSQVFYITGVVLLPGVEAPSLARAPFIVRPTSEEVLRCQRQFFSDFPFGIAPADNIQKSQYFGSAYSSAGIVSQRVDFPIAMLATPNVTLFSSTAKTSPTAGHWQYFNGTAWVDATSSAPSGVLPNGFQADNVGTFTATGSYLMAGSFKADARLPL